jgi:nitrogen fixation protein NifX
MTPALFKVAFATADRVSVNQHFGATLGFAIYAVDEEHAQLVEVAEFPSESMDGNESKLADKIAALSGCAAVYCLAIGASAVRQLLASGIQPVRMEDEIAIELLLIHLRKAIHEGGIAWIDRIVRRGCDCQRGEQRFDRMLEEGWQE